jgi:hypothetical protein
VLGCLVDCGSRERGSVVERFGPRLMNVLCYQPSHPGGKGTRSSPVNTW